MTPLRAASAAAAPAACPSSMQLLMPRTMPCGWQEIYDRLKALGQLDTLHRTEPPKNWAPARHGGPRKLIREDNIL